MKKRIVSAVLVIVMLCALVPSAMAAGGSMSNFTKKRSYSQCGFTDVPANTWYTENVVQAYEFGLVEGKSATSFDPGGNITIAETIAFAARIHKMYYYGNADFEKYGKWYQMYVDYAIDNGIIGMYEYSDYMKIATREEFGRIIDFSLPAEAKPYINKVTSIPDVSSSSSSYKYILDLYNSGIIVGTDEYGTYKPDSQITRAEVAAIISRLCVPELRQKVTLKGQEDPDADDPTEDDPTEDEPVEDDPIEEEPTGMDKLTDFIVENGIKGNEGGETYYEILLDDYASDENGTLVWFFDAMYFSASHKIVYELSMESELDTGEVVETSLTFTQNTDSLGVVGNKVEYEFVLEDYDVEATLVSNKFNAATYSGPVSSFWTVSKSSLMFSLLGSEITDEVKDLADDALGLALEELNVLCVLSETTLAEVGFTAYKI